MAGYNAWIERGMADGIFLLVGSLQPNAGGAILAHGATIDEMGSPVNGDPFVAEKVVSAETLEIKPGRADERLKFLMS